MPSSQLRRVEPSVWAAAAGNSVTIPAVNSRVYYFPQGHFDHSSLSSAASAPMIHCCVESVVLSADTVTDEVFAKIRLVPCVNGLGPVGDVAPPQQTVSVAKVLTPSDANNGGGFSMPKSCAETILPKLDYKEDPPVQNLSIRDIHGTTWKFRHIFRGTPRRHLFTTGWSKFVNAKKLIAGDSVVFMRNVGSGELSLGIRRATRCNSWSLEDSDAVEGSWKGGRGVAEAADLAARGLAFEVVYYPRVGCADFVVAANLVEESLNVFWTEGMKVKMATEKEDSATKAWFNGTVSAVFLGGSPWKMLEVAWDTPDYVQHLKRVNPWQVEHVMAPSLPHSILHPPTKKSRITRNPVLRDDEVQDLPFPILGISNSLMGTFNPSIMRYYALPASMQGARQSQFPFDSLPDFGQNTFRNNLLPKLKSVSAELNIHSSQSESRSLDTLSSENLYGSGRQGFVSSAKSVTSFQLFGKTIHVNGPEGNSADVVAVEGNGIAQIEEADRAEKLQGFSSNVPCRNLLAGLDVQSQGGLAVEGILFSNQQHLKLFPC